MIAIFLAVDDHFFHGFTVSCDADDRIVLALVMAVRQELVRSLPRIHHQAGRALVQPCVHSDSSVIATPTSALRLITTPVFGFTKVFYSESTGLCRSAKMKLLYIPRRETCSRTQNLVASDVFSGSRKSTGFCRAHIAAERSLNDCQPAWDARRSSNPNGYYIRLPSHR